MQPRHDRALLLHGAKRNAILTLAEVQQYGIDSFGDTDYVRLYGMVPAAWYARGIRILGRTAVECTRDALADRMGRDIAAAAAMLPSPVVIDPFSGSCNTLHWILRHVPQADGIACELDAQVHALTRGNLERLELKIELIHEDYEVLLANRQLPPGRGLIVFVAPPWGNALDESAGLDLRGTMPPVAGIIGQFTSRYADRPLLFATQVYEKVDAGSLAELRALFDWSDLRVYDLDAPGRNHGILLGTKSWKP